MPESARLTMPESSLPPEAAAKLAEAKRQLATVGGCALLIGVETYPGLPPDKQLFAGRNDVLAYWRVCRRLGYRARHIRMLTSPVLTRDEILQAEVDLALERDPHRTQAEVSAEVARRLADAPWGDMLGEATQQAIRAGVAWLAQRLVFTVKLEGEGWSYAKELTGLPGLLAYSGHGAQLDGDLALCPTDVGADLSRALLFGELRALIDAGDDIRAEGTPHPADNLTVVLDCCFAAGALPRGSLRVASLTPAGTTTPAVAKREIGNRVFCASGRDELSSQAVLGGRWHGAFTWAFTRALEQWKTAPSGQFQKSTISHVELLFRTRMLLEALSFPQHPVLMDQIGNLPVFQHDSDVADDTSPEPTAERRGGQMDPSSPYAYYLLEGAPYGPDGEWHWLAKVMAVKERRPGGGFEKDHEYWKFNRGRLPIDTTNFTTNCLRITKRICGWQEPPPFESTEVDWVCTVNPDWTNPVREFNGHFYETASYPAGTVGGVQMAIQSKAGGLGLAGSLQWLRPKGRDYLFKSRTSYVFWRGIRTAVTDFDFVQMNVST